jgi:hypothetical protein
MAAVVRRPSPDRVPALLVKVLFLDESARAPELGKAKPDRVTCDLAEPWVRHCIPGRARTCFERSRFTLVITVPVPRVYIGSITEADLSADAQVALGFLDEIVNGSEATATIDEDGSLSASVWMDGPPGLSIDIGNSWSAVHYLSRPTRTPYSWRWDSRTTPDELHALLAGRAVERIRTIGRRRLTAALVIEGRTVSTRGRVPQRLLAALLRQPQREHRIEPYEAPAYGDEPFLHARVDDGWLVVMRRNLSAPPIEWYLQHWNHDLSELRSESQHPFEGQAVMRGIQEWGVALDKWTRGPARS